MPSSSDAGNEAPRPITGHGPKLSNFSRSLTSLFGAVALVFGTLGVFVVDRDWGPIALLIIGVLLLLVGLSGRIPSLRWQDNEISWPAEEAAARAMVEVIESGSPDEQRQTLNRLSSVAPNVSAAALRALNFESRMMEGLREALPHGVVLEPGITVGKWRSDATLVNAAGWKVPVEIRSTNELPGALLGSVEKAKQLDSKIVSGLVLLRGEPGSKYRVKFTNAGWSIFDASEVHVDPADVGRLRTLIASIFEGAATI